MSFLSGGSVYGQVRSGKLRALAIASTQRAKMAPELQTLIEAGVPGYAVTQWHGMLAPRVVPRAVIERLHKEVVRAVRLPEVVARLALDSTEPVGSTPDQFAKFLASEREQWTKVVKSASIRVD
jgi:tripartite-type tricarboxylate transporter receptor subunit TctC